MYLPLLTLTVLAPIFCDLLLLPTLGLLYTVFYSPTLATTYCY